MGNKAEIHVACNIDSNYVKYCAVMLTSLLENNSDSCVHVHVIAASLPEGGQSVLRGVVEGRYGQKLSFHFPDASMLDGCRVNEGSYISLATYYRIFLGSILPPDVAKVLYLGCDLVVNGSVAPFWNTDISDVALGCVEDMWSGRPGIYERLHYPAQASYFNAGVLLVNLDRLRATGFERRAIDYLAAHADRLEMYDQDLLNALLHDDKRFVPHRWNVQDGFLRRRRVERMPADSVRMLEKELEHPVIIHYTGAKKPWHYKSQHPWRNLYFRYLDMTPWHGERPDMPLGYRLKLASDSLLRACGLMKPKYLKFTKI